MITSSECATLPVKCKLVFGPRTFVLLRAIGNIKKRLGDTFVSHRGDAVKNRDKNKEGIGFTTYRQM